MSIQYRCVMLSCLFVNTVSSSGVVQLGDSDKVTQFSRAIAVQRAIPNYEDDEFRFASYPLFLLPKQSLQPCKTVQFQSQSPFPTLQVGFVRTLGVSASSQLRVGNGGPLVAETRIKHIRQYNNLGIR
ncbi:spore germination protein GerPE [Cohnella sp. WQ 127256]|uniref:spore germination protein GerPE n=1 Tax=Cohnella sp. WQ 127256 TaxID=2938790 RepID=UPI0021196C17|nr:spore germination protein GerPE [Cohnella sp. WQ 127256]